MRRMPLIRWIGSLEIVFLLVPAPAGAQDRVRLRVEGGPDTEADSAWPGLASIEGKMGVSALVTPTVTVGFETERAVRCVSCAMEPVAAKSQPEGSPQIASWWPATKTQNARASGAVQQHPVPKRSWCGRHPVLTGALIGFGSGTALGAFGSEDDYSPFTRGEFALMIGGSGAVFGSLAGLVLAIVRR